MQWLSRLVADGQSGFSDNEAVNVHAAILPGALTGFTTDDQAGPAGNGFMDECKPLTLDKN